MNLSLSRSNRQFYLLQVLVWAAFAFEQFLAGIGVGRSLDYYKVCLIDFACGVVFTLIIRAVIEGTWNKSLTHRLWAGGLVLFVTSCAYGYVWKLVLYAMCDDCKPPPSYLGYISYFFGALYLLFAWTAAYVGIKLARSLQHEKETALHATAMAHQAQLRMLRYQLNPHFLFNTLNAISTLVLDGRRDQANGMVGALSGFLRYSLDSDPEQRVTLDQEIESVRRYLCIEQVRFDDRLRVGIMVTPEAASALVPSLILQPLIENAIKFAVSRREEAAASRSSRTRSMARSKSRSATTAPAAPTTPRKAAAATASASPIRGSGCASSMASTRALRSAHANREELW